MCCRVAFLAFLLIQGFCHKTESDLFLFLSIVIKSSAFIILFFIVGFFYLCFWF